MSRREMEQAVWVVGNLLLWLGITIVCLVLVCSLLSCAPITPRRYGILESPRTGACADGAPCWGPAECARLDRSYSVWGGILAGGLAASGGGALTALIPQGSETGREIAAGVAVGTVALSAVASFEERAAVRAYTIHCPGTAPAEGGPQ